jgi:hypothetical protein
LGDEYADAVEMIFMDQLPEVDHFTPVVLGSQCMKQVFLLKPPFISVENFIGKGRWKYNKLSGLKIIADFW